jgi:uncharacterized protein YndB with AHSA1/START domain
VTTDPGFAVEVEHRVPGSPETVFAYFTDPDKHRRWMGAEVELDARPGGIYRVAMAPDVWVSSEYLAVEPPHRLLLTWGWESGIDLPTGLKQVLPGSSAVEFRFVEDGDGTIIRVRHLGLPTEEARWTHGHGWNGYLPRLGSVLQDDDPGDDPVMTLATAFYARDAEALAQAANDAGGE